MNGKAYSNQALSIMITAADHYIEATDVRDRIIATCHWEIGMVVCDAPEHQRSAITLTPQEIKALNNSLAVSRLNGILKVRKILTPEQFQKFSEMGKKHKKKRNGSHKGSHQGNYNY